MKIVRSVLGSASSGIRTQALRITAFIAFLAAAACMFGSIQSLAQTHKREAWGATVKPREPAAIIKMFDGNGDGKIDQTEYLLQIVRVFSDLDENRDDFLQPNELPGMDSKNFLEADKDKDKKLSPYEFVRADSLQFEAIDNNSDGLITETEIAEHQGKFK